MKKIALLLVAVSMLFLSACGNNGGEKVIEGNVQTIESGGTQSGGTGGEASGASEDAQSEAAQADGSVKGYVFIYNGVTIEMDADAAPIIEKLGEPVSYFEAASCAFEGLDKMYTYNGFELDTYPVGDKDYVSSVIVKDDSVTTAEGICIGDSLEKLQQAYGGEGEGSGGETMVAYTKDGMDLCFIMQGQEIISIEYRSTVLNENGGQGN